MTFTTLPDWTLPRAGSVIDLFETVALAGLEGTWIRLSAADQRRVIGFPIFGSRTSAEHTADLTGSRA